MPPKISEDEFNRRKNRSTEQYFDTDAYSSYQNYLSGVKIGSGITPQAGYELDPNNPNRVRKIGEQTTPDLGSISSANLGSTPSLKLPTYNTQTPEELLGVTSAQKSPMDIYNQIYGSTAEEQNQDNYTKEITNLLGGFADQGAYVDAEGKIVAPQFRAQKENELGLTKMRTELAELSGGLETLKAESLAIPLQVQNEFTGRGATRGGVEPIQTARLRENAIKTLSLSAQASAKLGLIADAEKKLEKAVELEFAPQIARLNYLKQTYEMNKDTLERTDKKRADKLKLELDERTRVLEEEQERRTQKNNVMLEAGKNKADRETMQKIQNAKTVDDAIVLATPFLAPPDKPNLQVVKLDNGQSVVVDLAQKGKIVNNLGGQAPVGANAGVLQGQYGRIIQSAANLVGAERGKTSLASMSSAIADNDWVSAYAQIANNVEESLTGEAKSRFSSARTDYSVMQGLRNTIQDYVNAGGDTNLLKGTADEVARKIGVLGTDPRFASLATQLSREFQTYRQTMTGAAFSPQESAEYAKVNPTGNKSLDLNLAVIDGALNQLENRVVSTIKTRIPGSEEIYTQMGANTKSASDGLSDDVAYQQYLNTVKQYGGSK